MSENQQSPTTLKELTVTSVESWQNVVDEIVKTQAKVILLTGNLGAGKTTLTQFLVKGFESTSIVTSPTFSLVNVYEYPEGSIYHMDLYRLESYEELFNAGIEEYFYEKDAICIVEWPELIKDTDLTENAILVEIEVNENERKVKIERV